MAVTLNLILSASSFRSKSRNENNHSPAFAKQCRQLAAAIAAAYGQPYARAVRYLEDFVDENIGVFLSKRFNFPTVCIFLDFVLMALEFEGCGKVPFVLARKNKQQSFSKRSFKVCHWLRKYINVLFGEDAWDIFCRTWLAIVSGPRRVLIHFPGIRKGASL